MGLILTPRPREIRNHRLPYLTTAADPWARADAHRKGGAPYLLRAKKNELEKPSQRNPNKISSRSP